MNSSVATVEQETQIQPWKVTSWVCSGVVVVSVLACFVLAAARSNGLTKVTVTALNENEEPRDAGVRLLKRKDALPDYEIFVLLQSGSKIHLGAKPNSSAVEGLAWTLTDPISISEIASVRLQEQDKVISDPIAEVQCDQDSVVMGNYRFEFETTRSASVGIKSFFKTPIGLAIAAAFFVAVFISIAGNFVI